MCDGASYSDSAMKLAACFLVWRKTSLASPNSHWTHQKKRVPPLYAWHPEGLAWI